VTDRLLRITQLTNFQTRDFEGGLAKAAATGAVFGQSLDDVLITMGLLRNRNIDASSAGTAFREATRRVGAETAEPSRPSLGTGVEVFDRTRADALDRRHHERVRSATREHERAGAQPPSGHRFRRSRVARIQRSDERLLHDDSGRHAR
jgi:hypothetical protein